jgi:hypothetical protein
MLTSASVLSCPELRRAHIVALMSAPELASDDAGHDQADRAAGIGNREQPRQRTIAMIARSDPAGTGKPSSSPYW